MTRTRHQCRAACIKMAVLTENIRYAVGNPAAEFRFALGRYAAGADRIRRLPCARCIDHCTRPISTSSGGSLDHEHKRLALTSPGQNLVGSPAGDRDDAGIGFDEWRQLGRLASGDK